MECPPPLGKTYVLKRCLFQLSGSNWSNPKSLWVFKSPKTMRSGGVFCRPWVVRPWCCCSQTPNTERFMWSMLLYECFGRLKNFDEHLEPKNCIKLYKIAAYRKRIQIESHAESALRSLPSVAPLGALFPGRIWSPAVQDRTTKFRTSNSSI